MTLGVGEASLVCAALINWQLRFHEMSVSLETKRASVGVRLNLTVGVETNTGVLPALAVNVGMGGIFVSGFSCGQFALSRLVAGPHAS